MSDSPPMEGMDPVMPTATAARKPTKRTARKPAAKPKKAAAPAVLELYSHDVNAVKAVALAASNDAGRPVLNALQLRASGGVLTVTATDSYRLHRATIPCEVADFDASVPAAWLIKTLREVKPGKAQPSLLKIDPGFASVENADEHRSVKLIAGDYPDCDGLFAKHECDHAADTLTCVDPKFFADVLKACDLFDESRRGTRFSVSETQLHPLRFMVRDVDRLFEGLLMPLRMKDQRQ